MDPKSDENCESIPMALTREPASVPNFRTLQKSSSLDEEEEARQQKKVTAQALEKATALMEEAAVAAASQNGKQVAAAAASANTAINPELRNNDKEQLPPPPPPPQLSKLDLNSAVDEAIINSAEVVTAAAGKGQQQMKSPLEHKQPPMATLARSDSAYTFQSYDYSSSRSSTLSSSGTGSNSSNGTGKINNMTLPKSSSTKFKVSFVKGQKKRKKSLSLFCSCFLQTGSDIRLIDLDEEELATYADEFSSLSGYESIEAVDHMRDEDCQSRLSFANPHYLGPDVQAILERKRVSRRNVLLRDESHQSFAQALNSPADSLFSDYQVNKDRVI